MEQLLYLLDPSRIYYPYEFKNNKPSVPFIYGYFRHLLFVCWILLKPSRTGKQLQYLIIQSRLTRSNLFLVSGQQEMDLQYHFIQLAFFGNLFIHNDQQSPLINCITSSYYQWNNIGQISTKKQKADTNYHLDKAIHHTN